MTADAKLLKQNLKIDYSDEDELIEELVTQARAAAEDYLGREYPEGATPPQMRAAVQLWAGFFFEHRSEAGGKDFDSMHKAFKNILYPLRETDVMI